MKLTAVQPRPPAKLAIVGPPNVGKTVFICSNCALPVWALDPDGRFPDYLDLLLKRSSDPGEVPEDPSIYLDTVRMYNEARIAQHGNKFQSLVVDSITKPFQGLARTAHLMNRAQRAGDPNASSGNLSDRLQEKALFISTISSITSMFKECWLTWHYYEGKDDRGKDRVAETVSKTERDRLFQSLSARLDFGKDDKKGYWVKPVWARDWRGVTPNIGFTLYDKPANFWQGGLDRLFGIMYASFSGKDEAIAAAVRASGLPVDEVSAQYEAQRKGVSKSSEMWFKWALYIDGLPEPGLPQPDPIPSPEPVQIAASDELDDHRVHWEGEARGATNEFMFITALQKLHQDNTYDGLAEIRKRVCVDEISAQNAAAQFVAMEKYLDVYDQNLPNVGKAAAYREALAAGQEKYSQLK